VGVFRGANPQPAYINFQDWQWWPHGLGVARVAARSAPRGHPALGNAASCESHVAVGSACEASTRGRGGRAGRCRRPQRDDKQCAVGGYAQAGKIAFWRAEKDRCAILTIDPDGTNLRRITRWQSLRDCSAPTVWSPDGTRLAFYARGALWVMNPDGAQRQRLAAADYPESGGPGPSWSPDGRRLVFNRNPDAHRIASAIYTVRVDGTGLRRLTPERFAEAPAWSPDGTRIAFKSDVTNEGELLVMRPDGTHRQRLTQNDDVEESFAWSPDGTKLAFLTTSLYSIDPNGAGRRLLTELADYSSTFAWSPEGQRIAFSAENDFDSVRTDIFVMSAKGFGEHSLTKRGFNSEPSWSPDGRSIVCWYFQRLKAPSESGLKIISADGKGVRRLTDGDDSSPAWQPRRD
jgi:Tol biopolymer transport system component